ncbi:MAG: hypothetical protein KME03_06380 [Aphanocapsa lilacina HA4352-LM1]|nr:hypothetical protein [Aphanocapsa lilacina HA4352-LM1]
MNLGFYNVDGRIWGFAEPHDIMPVPLPLAMTSAGLIVNFFGESAEVWERKGWGRPVYLPYRPIGGGGLVVIDALPVECHPPGFVPALPLPVRDPG